MMLMLMLVLMLMLAVTAVDVDALVLVLVAGRASQARPGQHSGLEAGRSCWWLWLPSLSQSHSGLHTATVSVWSDGLLASTADSGAQSCLAAGLVISHSLQHPDI